MQYCAGPRWICESPTDPTTSVGSPWNRKKRAPRSAWKSASAASVAASQKAGVSIGSVMRGPDGARDRKSTRLNSSHVEISYAVFCLKKKKKKKSEKKIQMRR